MTFQNAQLNLLAYVRGQIRNGELTERGFARLIGISQPHVHNVLKGVRNFSPEILDLALKYLHLSLLDLVPEEQVEAHLRARRAQRHSAEAPFLDQPIGPGMPWPSGLNLRRKLPLPFPSFESPANLVMAPLIPDPSMQSLLGSSDVALLDLSPNQPSALVPEGLFVVERRNEAILRYIRPGARRYYLATAETLNTPAYWEILPLNTSGMAAAVKARVRWIGEERSGGNLDQRGRFLYDPISS
ncbi:MAG TPA: helix-turn-helix transcriptional regulator [Bryobacteraceae bacterium]|nr:helix-turn-helix transcriptional regulator [Bryobacteraceae bacterium]